MIDSREHWVVRLNWRNRSVFFVMAFAVLGTHLAHIHAGAMEWALLALQFLAYPQFVYWRARRASDPLRAEMHNLLVDDVLLGMWMAHWGFPLWVSFMLFIGACLNLMIFHGIRGLWKAVAAMAIGVGLMALLAEFSFRPQASLLTSALCMLILTLYLLMFAHDAYTRGVALRENRKQLNVQIAEITSLQDQLRDQASRDPLTGLYNRRHLDQALARELAGRRDSGTPLALVLIDIDRFKAINDSYGHLAGDEMIKALARVLARHAGSGDLVCRYGGEEFLLLLPDRTLAQASQLAEQLRQAFERLQVPFEGQSMQATLSCGIAGFPEHAPEPRVLVQMADKALYVAKVQGRNRTVLSTELEEGLDDLIVE